MTPRSRSAALAQTKNDRPAPRHRDSDIGNHYPDPPDSRDRLGRAFGCAFLLIVAAITAGTLINTLSRIF